MTRKKKGAIHIYTGNGKGKTTAALGIALRAAGWGMKTYIGQFMKGQKYGELTGVKYLGNLVVIEQFGRKGFLHVGSSPSQKDIIMAKKGLISCKEAMFSGMYDIVVMDEINVAVYFRLIEEKEVLDVIKSKPDGIELILTGRYAPSSFLKLADLITEMNDIRHYYTRGLKARKGIEF